MGAALLLGACGPAAVDTIRPGGHRTAVGLHVGAGDRVVASTGADVAPVVGATWTLGLAALGAAAPGDGAVVSPSSLYVALSMLADGSSGAGLALTETALGARGDARRDALVALRDSLAAYDGDPALVGEDELPERPVLHQASQLVVDDDRTASEAYLDTLWQVYGAGVLRTDLATEEGFAPVHAWVSEHTGGLVERSAIAPNAELVAVLQDAVALAARWEQVFAGPTSDEPFHLADGTTADVPTMHGDVTAATTQVDGWQAVRLRYATSDGPGLHADLLLPPEGTDVRRPDRAVLERLTAGLDVAVPDLVELQVPRLDLTTRTDLSEAFRAAGLGHVMSSETSGIDRVLEPGVPPLFVGTAVQQAVLQLDEDGTRAAALTEFGMEAVSAPAEPLVALHVDRPFLLVVADSTTGWPVFLAAVDDPS